MLRCLTVLLALFAAAPLAAQFGARHICHSVTVEPDSRFYTIDDTVVMTVRNICSDTLLVAASLYSYQADGWEMIVADLENYWRPPGPGLSDEWADLHSISPGETYTFRISIAQVAAIFRRRLVLALGVNGLVAHPSPDTDRDIHWAGHAFLVQPPDNEDDSLLDIIKVRTPQRDTAFTSYDPIANTPVIPLSIFTKPPTLLMLRDPFDTVAIARAATTRREIIWEAPSIDGSLELVITRRQIWLESGHNNPNPNHIYWATDISAKQFDAIDGILARHRGEFNEVVPGYGFTYYLYWKNATPEIPIPEEWTDEQWRVHEEDFKRKRYVNARRLIDMINKGLPAGERIAFPTREKLDAMPQIRIESAL